MSSNITSTNHDNNLTTIHTKPSDTLVSAYNNYVHYRSIFYGHTPSFTYLMNKYPEFKKLYVRLINYKIIMMMIHSLI